MGSQINFSKYHWIDWLCSCVTPPSTLLVDLCPLGWCPPKIYYTKPAKLQGFRYKHIKRLDIYLNILPSSFVKSFRNLGEHITYIRKFAHEFSKRKNLPEDELISSWFPWQFIKSYIYFLYQSWLLCGCSGSSQMNHLSCKSDKPRSGGEYCQS